MLGATGPLAGKEAPLSLAKLQKAFVWFGRLEEGVVAGGREGFLTRVFLAFIECQSWQ